MCFYFIDKHIRFDKIITKRGITQWNITIHEQDHTHIVSEGEGESILLTKCGYGIAILPGFMLGHDEEVKYIPIDQSKNIHYGIYYKSIIYKIRY